MAQTNNKREIYMFKSMGELLKGLDPPHVVNNNEGMINQSAKMLIESADNILKEGRKSYEAGDEENAFILYMRACELYMNVKKHKDYKTDQRYFESLTRPGILESIDKAESLKTSLKGRYGLLNLTRHSSEVKKRQDAVRLQEELLRFYKEKQQQEATSKISGVIKPSSDPSPPAILQGGMNNYRTTLINHPSTNTPRIKIFTRRKWKSRSGKTFKRKLFSEPGL